MRDQVTRIDLSFHVPISDLGHAGSPSLTACKRRLRAHPFETPVSLLEDRGSLHNPDAFFRVGRGGRADRALV